jgi:hypothetical protein
MASEIYRFYLGAVLTSSQPVEFLIQITQTEPVYYYCAQPGHCQAGMVGTINAPYDDAGSFMNFSSMAFKASTAAIPSTVGGGMWVDEATSPAWSATATSGATEAVTMPTGVATGGGGGVASGLPSATATATGLGTASGTSAVASASQTGGALGRGLDSHAGLVSAACCILAALFLY